MIKNLPKQFPISALMKFDFGDAEAQQDSLLPDCPVPTAAIADFLTDKKDIVLGYRGSGKSAVVRLLSEGKLAFHKGEGEWKPLVLCLNEEFSFRLITSVLQRQNQNPKEQKLICRVVWEILLIYRALQEIKERHGNCDPTIEAHLEDLDAVLGVAPRKVGLIEILLTTKKKIGVKIDSNLPSIVDLYAGLEPNVSPAAEERAVTLKLVEYKKHLNRLLHDEKLTLYVLFDRLDDFVAQEDYETQRLLLHGLLSTQLDYRQKYPRVKIKAFIRTDLFRKLDLSEFGPDKIVARCVILKWSPNEIKHFVANRLAINLMKTLGLPFLHFSIDKDEFQVSRDELAKLQENKKSIRMSAMWSWAFWRGLFWLTRLNRRKRREYEGRMRDSTEVIHEMMITSIFPTEVPHTKANGVEATISVFEYLETHFQFGHGETTPRAMLSFLNYFLQSVQRYYRDNPDISQITRNQNGEYPLFVKRAVKEAYAAHKQDAWEVQYNWAHPWKPLVGVIQRISERRCFSYADFLKLAGVAEDEARQFLAFCTHTGLIQCLNDRERHDLRQYEFPVLFRTAAARSG